MTIHLYLHRTGKPACGLAVGKGETVTQAYYRDLCENCLAWQAARCAYFKQHKKWPPD